MGGVRPKAATGQAPGRRRGRRRNAAGRPPGSFRGDRPGKGMPQARARRVRVDRGSSRASRGLRARTRAFPWREGAAAADQSSGANPITHAVRNSDSAAGQGMPLACPRGPATVGAVRPTDAVVVAVAGALPSKGKGKRREGRRARKTRRLAGKETYAPVTPGGTAGGPGGGTPPVRATRVSHEGGDTPEHRDPTASEPGGHTDMLDPSDCQTHIRDSGRDVGHALGRNRTRLDATFIECPWCG